MTYGPKPVDPVTRFWPKVNKTGTCWLWLGATSRHGYGKMKNRDRRLVFAHRFAWQLEHGPIPEGMCVCHHCDVPACVNPAHLFLGTMLDNVRDMHAKQRDNKARGESHPRAKLTEASVVEIRSLVLAGISRRHVAHQFCVTHQSITKIINRKSWKHVTWEEKQ